jgi:hypothetical protein
MSKKFKGKTCVYCGKPKSSTEADHVFAKEFFLPSRRNNLPKVPTCRQCNKEKSILEHYLTAVLPFGGTHKDARNNLETIVPPRLSKNRQLFRQLLHKKEDVWVKEGSFLLPSLKLPFDSSKIGELFCFIVRGLLWHHLDVLLPPSHSVRAGSLTKVGEKLFENLFNGRASQRLKVDLGESTFRYEAAQGIDSSHLSIWKFSVYGGLKLGDDPEAPLETSSLIWGIAGRSKIINELWDIRIDRTINTTNI